MIYNLPAGSRQTYDAIASIFTIGGAGYGQALAYQNVGRRDGNEIPRDSVVIPDTWLLPVWRGTTVYPPGTKQTYDIAGGGINITEAPEKETAQNNWILWAAGAVLVYVVLSGTK